MWPQREFVADHGIDRERPGQVLGDQTIEDQDPATRGAEYVRGGGRIDEVGEPEEQVTYG